MKIDRKNFIPALVLAILFLGIIVGVQPYPMASKRLLVVVSLLGLILTGIIMVKSAWPKKEQDEADEEATVSHGEKHEKKVPRGALLSALAWVVGILIVVHLFGLQFGLPLYACLYYKLHDGAWLGTVILGISLFVFLYLVLTVLLDAVTPPGLLFELFTEYFAF